MIHLSGLIKKQCKTNDENENDESSEPVVTIERHHSSQGFEANMKRSVSETSLQREGSTPDIFHDISDHDFSTPIESSDDKVRAPPEKKESGHNLKRPKQEEEPTGGGFGSSFLQNLCKIANSQKLDRYFCFCHKNGLLMFQDLVDFEAFLNCKENTKLKARTFRQLHRQIVLRGFTEVVDEKMNSMSTVAYVHPNKEMMNLMRNEVKERKNCCRRHYKLVT